MKKLLLGLVATVLFSFSGFANEGNNGFNGQIKINTIENQNQRNVNSETLINFNTIQDFKDFSANGLEIVTLCDVSVTVSVGVGATYASATVTAHDIDCATLASAIKRLKAQALAALE